MGKRTTAAEKSGARAAGFVLDSVTGYWEHESGVQLRPGAAGGEYLAYTPLAARWLDMTHASFWAAESLTEAVAHGTREARRLADGGERRRY